MAASKILVPVDGSPNSIRALEYAAKRCADSKGAWILALNVQTPMPASRFVTREMIRDHYARMSEAAFKPVNALKKKLGIDIDCYMRVGEPASTIVDFAKRTRCTEIVMGTRGLGRVSGLVMGSVAMKVVHLSPIPVTLVK
ncbi:MAG: universal stress protein [Pseudomonadota bacterium]|jgi:Universal stress protein UspA and related nucleotide-binding proteins|nr:MAG: universal stress protein [Pseudomonadota bacterium]